MGEERGERGEGEGEGDTYWSSWFKYRVQMHFPIVHVVVIHILLIVSGQSCMEKIAVAS